MKEYFQLQYKITTRKCKDAGVQPLLACLLATIAFVSFSQYLFSKTTFAAPVYLLLALSVTGKFSDIKRNDFLRLCFGGSKHKKIRVTENFLIATPFLIFLAFKQQYIPALVLLILTSLLALFNFRTTLSITIPTPFYKKPFEFAAGFRNTFYLLAATYTLTGIALAVTNFNLGVFSLLLIFAITLGYYTQPENEYYVWVHALTARQFLFTKIKTALWYSTYLAFPVALVLGIFYPQQIITLLLFFLAGWAFLIFIILSKYAAYPDEFNITQAILLCCCISFPPLLLVLIPYLFYKSQNRLHSLLK